LRFTADNDYIELPTFNIPIDTSSLLEKSSFTVTFWMKLHQAPSAEANIYIFEKPDVIYF